MNLISVLSALQIHSQALCRQPEFSQLDMEMTFMNQNAIIGLVEQLVATIFSKVKPLAAEEHREHRTTPP